MVQLGLVESFEVESSRRPKYTQIEAELFISHLGMYTSVFPTESVGITGVYCYEIFSTICFGLALALVEVVRASY